MSDESFLYIYMTDYKKKKLSGVYIKNGKQESVVGL